MSAGLMVPEAAEDRRSWSSGHDSRHARPDEGTDASAGACRGRLVVAGGWLVVADDDAVTAGRLGGVQGAVGAADQLVGDLLAIPASKAGGKGLALGRDRTEPLEDLGGLVGGGGRQEHAELLAAVAAEQVGGSQHAAP